jgi:hypothetical protein
MPDRYGEKPDTPTDCQLCDNDGYRGTQVCDHTDHTAAAQRGMANIRAIMGWKTPKNPPTDQPEPKNTTP